MRLCTDYCDYRARERGAWGCGQELCTFLHLTCREAKDQGLATQWNPRLRSYEVTEDRYHPDDSRSVKYRGQAIKHFQNVREQLIAKDSTGRKRNRY